MLKQSDFLNEVPFITFSLADATKSEQDVTHLFNIKAIRFYS